MTDRNASVEKKAYEPPSLRKVNLAADEVLAVGCKTAQGGFNSGASPCRLRKCVKNGS